MSPPPAWACSRRSARARRCPRSSASSPPVPIGVTLSFLIASPLVNEVAIVLLYGLFGFKIVALYVASRLLIAVVAGWALDHQRAT